MVIFVIYSIDYMQDILATEQKQSQYSNEKQTDKLDGELLKKNNIISDANASVLSLIIQIQFQFNWKLLLNQKKMSNDAIELVFDFGSEMWLCYSIC